MEEEEKKTSEEKKEPEKDAPAEKEEKKEENKPAKKEPEVKSSSSRGLLITVIALAVVVVGLLIFIIAGGKKKSKTKKADETPTEAVSEAETEMPKEAASEETSEAEQETEEDTASPPTEDVDTSASYALSCKVSEGSSWTQDGKTVVQFNISILNGSPSDQKDWEVRLPGFTGAEILTGWSGTYRISGDTLTVTAADYNVTIPKGEGIDLGVQVIFPSQSEADAAVAGLTGKKTFPIYVAGVLQDAEKEPAETMSEDKKEEIRQEKPAAEEGSPLENHGALFVKGTDLVDQDGKPYQLKGISTHGLAWFPQYVNEEAFREFRDQWGANVIRLAMYTGESGGYCSGGNQDELKKLVNTGVDLATELGMYVIIDWHILSDSNPLTHEDEAILFFDEMSARYADYDNVLFEICNEPNGGTSWEDVKSYAEDVIPVIRKNKSNAVIIVGTPTWSQDVDLAAENPVKVEDYPENLLYTIHFYAATHKDNIREKVRKAHDLGLPMIVSEFSICDASGNGGIDYDSADEWFSLIDEYNLSYIGWNLSNKNETSSLISSSCTRTSGWEDADLSETGLWLKKKISGE